MKDSKPIVIVISRNHSVGLGVVRSLGRAGYTVDLIASTYRADRSAIIAGSKYIRKFSEVVQRKEKDFKHNEIIDVIKGYIDESHVQPIVLMPTDDYTAAVIDMNRDALKDNFIIPFGSDRISVKDFSNHDFQSKITGELGFAEFSTRRIGLSNIAVPVDLDFPCVCKPVDYITSSDSEISIMYDATELKIHLNMLRRRDADRQAVIYNLPDSAIELEINGLCLGNDVIIPGVAQYTEYSQYDKLIPIKGIICSTDGYKEACSKVSALLKTLNYTGMFSVGLYVTGDEIYLKQVQLSVGQAGHVYGKCGVDFYNALIEYVMHGIRNNIQEIKSDRKFLFDNIVDAEYRKELITHKEKRSMLSSNSIMCIRDNEDPYPGKLSARVSEVNGGYENLYMKRKVKNFIKSYIFPIFRPIKQMVLQYPQLDPANERNPKSERPRVIVSGRNYGSNLCIARAIGKAGYEVEVLRIFHRKPKMRQLLRKLIPDAYSKHIKAFWTCVYGGKSMRVVNKFISLADPDRKMLIVPADDLVACIIDDYYDELSQHFVLPNVSGKSGEINRLMSKSVQKELAIKAGLPVAKSCIIKTEEGEFEIPDTVDYPCFIKPNISKNGSKTKMRRCDSRQELWDAIVELAEQKDVEMLVEDFIEIGKEYSILGISTKNGAIGPGFFGAEEGGQVEHRGVAVTGKVLPCDFTPEWQKLIEDTVRFVGSLDFDGLYDVDFIETVDGKLYFVEVNMRFGGSGYAITQSGLNLPGMFADYMLLNRPIDMDCRLEQTGKTFVSEKVLIEEYVKNRITMSRLNEIMDNVDIHFIKDDKDPAAFKHFKKFYKIAALYRLVYKIKDTSDSEFGK